MLLDTLLIDTGSSNTWVGAGQPYVKTSTSQETDDSAVISHHRTSVSALTNPCLPVCVIWIWVVLWWVYIYDSRLHYIPTSSFLGTEYLDTVTIALGLVISQQSIGVASNSTGFDGFDGILG